MFVYNSVKRSIQSLFSWPDFEKKINAWRDRRLPDGMMLDIYDGRMWQAIPDPDEPDRPFADHKRSLLLTLNVDWFQPFDGGGYSCGAIYITVNNLPRNDRFKKENVL